jgi:hypothetical protein
MSLDVDHDIGGHFRAMELAANERARRHPIDAKLYPDGESMWHVVVTHPGAENIAAGHLMNRRFGVYLPTTYKEVYTRGRKRVVRRPLFSGYVFLFVQQIERQWRQIEACPGVMRILTITEGEPVGADIPRSAAIVPDKLINHLQGVETTEMLRERPDIVLPKRRRRLDAWLRDAGAAVTLSTRSHWNFDGMGEDERKSALHKALARPN